MVLDPKRQLDGSPLTVNERLFDALLRHQIGLLRIDGRVRRRLISILDATEKDIADRIRSRLSEHKNLTTRRDHRILNALIKSISTLRGAAWDKAIEEWLRDIGEIATAEAATTAGLINVVSPVVLSLDLPSTQLINGILRSRPFEGRTLHQWAQSIRRADLERIEAQIRIGMVQGQSGQTLQEESLELCETVVEVLQKLLDVMQMPSHERPSTVYLISLEGSFFKPTPIFSQRSCLLQPLMEEQQPSADHWMDKRLRWAMGQYPLFTSVAVHCV